MHKWVIHGPNQLYHGIQTPILYFIHSIFNSSLFRKKRFEINFFVQRNASKHIYKKRKPTQFFSFFISSIFEFYLVNALFSVDIDQGIHKVKLKVARNEKRKKLHGFSFSINIANFEAFRWTKKLISNLFFLKSVHVCNVLHTYISTFKKNT